MPTTITRRSLLERSLLAAQALRPGSALSARAGDAKARLRALEAAHHGRLGVSAIDLATGRRVAHREDERFALCSTFKFLAAAFVLARVDRGEERLDRSVRFTEADLVSYSPVTKDRVGAPGMTLAELCDAAVTTSDNTAANLLLASFGGPSALTAYLRSLGDGVTRLDRIEPELNEAASGDPRDTTTPAAMAETTRRLVVGDGLAAPSRERLAGWLVANKTGDARLRAGFPRAWRVGDKTGTGGRNTTNDVAVAWPPDRPPVIVAAYYADSMAPLDDRSAVLAEVARIVASP